MYTELSLANLLALTKFLDTEGISKRFFQGKLIEDVWVSDGKVKEQTKRIDRPWSLPNWI